MTNPTSSIPSPLYPPAIPAGRDSVPSVAPANDFGDGAQASASGTSGAGLTEDAAIQHLKDVLRTVSIDVQFEIDQDTHRVITKVVDKSSGEVIRQLPSKEVMRIAHAMQNLQGMFVHQKA